MIKKIGFIVYSMQVFVVVGMNRVNETGFLDASRVTFRMEGVPQQQVLRLFPHHLYQDLHKASAAKPRLSEAQGLSNACEAAMHSCAVEDLELRIHAAKGYLVAEALRVDKEWLQVANEALDLIDKLRIPERFGNHQLNGLCLNVQMEILEYINAKPVGIKKIKKYRNAMRALHTSICQLSGLCCTIN